MEYAKDEIFNIRYNEYEDVLEVGKKKRVRRFIKQHKWISMAIGATIVTIGIDGALLYEFVLLLSTL